MAEKKETSSGRSQSPAPDFITDDEEDVQKPPEYMERDLRRSPASSRREPREYAMSRNIGTSRDYGSSREYETPRSYRTVASYATPSSSALVPLSRSYVGDQEAYGSLMPVSSSSRTRYSRRETYYGESSRSRTSPRGHCGHSREFASLTIPLPPGCRPACTAKLYELHVYSGVCLRQLEYLCDHGLIVEDRYGELIVALSLIPSALGAAISRGLALLRQHLAICLAFNQYAVYQFY
ncbi:hypothetical protein McanMca71_003333 [Microsporum canis]|uniref:Uncharacterized protein n=1 Tax=Arthroderma otae (strain ATCC MYA-4605 / CBS 113480) TaxID=554155 RepID=C5FSF0_ARTOC|nr:uncharacterized protein MCYG_05622 [Microsporum canis CBS 113480]EEQ32803.1 predicted protein [Microsporum canis CBS 113480]